MTGHRCDGLRDSPRRRAFPGRNGFTVVDAIATLAIVAVTGTIAMPAVSRFVEASRVRAAGWTLAADLQRTRQLAIAGNRSHRLTLSTTEVEPDSGETRVYGIAPTGAETPARRRELPPGVALRNAPGSWIEFNSRGLATGATELRLHGGGPGDLVIRVRSTGLVDLGG